jgi:hypothetical protein
MASVVVARTEQLTLPQVGISSIVRLLIGGGVVIAAVAYFVGAPPGYTYSVKCRNGFTAAGVRAIRAFGSLQVISADAKIMRQLPIEDCEVSK